MAGAATAVAAAAGGRAWLASIGSRFLSSAWVERGGWLLGAAAVIAAGLGVSSTS